MKMVHSLAIVGIGLSAHAGIVAGPIVNPANSHSYYLLSQNTWNNAEREAVSLGGHLATIHSLAENQWIFDTFGSFGGIDRALWIGLSDRDVKGTFRWVSGDPVVFTNWASGEPNNGLG